MTEAEMQQCAEEYARTNREHLAATLTNIEQHPEEARPFSIFMAGSPGAGKTEVSKRLLEEVAARGTPTVRIDTDEYRDYFVDCGYIRSNSHLFQRAATLITERVVDHALKKYQSFILDGTFSYLEKARSNIQRCVKQNREVVICFVYQDPQVAWDFVQKREAQEGRRVQKATFIQQFLDAQKTVQIIKDEFGDKVGVYFLDKTVGGVTDFVFNITHIDKYVSKKYSKEELEAIISHHYAVPNTLY